LRQQRFEGQVAVALRERVTLFDELKRAVSGVLLEAGQGEFGQRFVG
jgi:hypothetical protein